MCKRLGISIEHFTRAVVMWPTAVPSLTRSSDRSRPLGHPLLRFYFAREEAHANA